MPVSQSGNTGQMHNCPRCGESNSSSALACSGCGARMITPIPNPPPAPAQTAQNPKVKFLPAEQPWWQKTDWLSGAASVLGVLFFCAILYVFLTHASNGSSLRYVSGVPLLYLVRFIVNRLID